MTRNCIICRENISKISAKAVLSPWIRKLGIKQRISNFLTCPNCGIGFFSYRYTDEEMHCIYRNYRGEKYVAIRNYWEPWYDFTYNSNHNNEAWVSVRVDAVTGFINKFELKPNVVIDVGGDRGQYIPNLGQEVSVVIDTSNKEPVKGVTRKSLLSEVYKPDLIFLSHVLEHVANPIATLKELFLYSNTIYVEVPHGVPEISKKRRSKIRFLIKLISTISPLFWRRFAIPATGKKSGDGVLIQSEHINFFTEISLVALAKKLGSKIELEVNEIATPDGGRARVIQCLLFAHD
jgi:hypothetical protein